jgi:hypothetical protein
MKQSPLRLPTHDFEEEKVVRHDVSSTSDWSSKRQRLSLRVSMSFCEYTESHTPARQRQRAMTLWAEIYERLIDAVERPFVFPGLVGVVGVRLMASR